MGKKHRGDWIAGGYQKTGRNPADYTYFGGGFELPVVKKRGTI